MESKGSKVECALRGLRHFNHFDFLLYHLVTVAILNPS